MHHFIVFKIEKPLHGKISEFSGVFGTLMYTPKPGFVGTDFFTFKLQLGSLSSILATVAITVDTDLTKARKIGEQRKLGSGVLQAKRSSLLGNLKNSMVPGSLVSSSSASSEVSGVCNNPLAVKHKDSRHEMELVERERSNSRSKAAHVVESDSVSL